MKITERQLKQIIQEEMKSSSQTLNSRKLTEGAEDNGDMLSVAQAYADHIRDGELEPYEPVKHRELLERAEKARRALEELRYALNMANFNWTPAGKEALPPHVKMGDLKELTKMIRAISTLMVPVSLVSDERKKEKLTIIPGLGRQK